MAKPILIVQIIGNMHYLVEVIEKIASEVEQKLEEEYHVLIIPSIGKTEIKFQAFYEKDFTEVNYDELKQIVFKSVNNIASFDTRSNEIQDAYKILNNELKSIYVNSI